MNDYISNTPQKALAYNVLVGSSYVFLKTPLYELKLIIDLL